MSGHGFHVHGPHELEHVAQHAGKSGKQNLAEIKAAAEKLEADSKSWDDQSEAQLHNHHRWAQATTALQIAIALLTGRKWLEWGLYGVAGLGVMLGVAAALHL